VEGYVKYSSVALILLMLVPGTAADAQPVRPVVSTTPLYNYEEAPATPDADDPAIWVNRTDHRQSLVIGTAKDAGLLVYTLNGRLVQAILPPNAPQVLPEDPATPAGVNLSADHPCPDSESGDTFGRYNNVDIAYDVRVGKGSRARSIDVAIVSDRGCDRVRFFKIDRSDPEGPLVDVTSPDVPRVFPDRYDQPSALQPSGVTEGWRDNPVDDQNTVYGLTVAPGRDTELFVTQRERGLVRQLRVEPTANGLLTYSLKRTFLFKTEFDFVDAQGAAYSWTPCREAVQEEPQSEGLVFDAINETLFVAFETIGLYRISLKSNLPSEIVVDRGRLIEPLTIFGRAYRATPDDDEFECSYDAEGVPGEDDIVAPGSDIHAGEFLEADLEGLSIVRAVPGYTLMLASSQGDSSFHFYGIQSEPQHLGSFLIDGVGETDGVHYVATPLGREFPLGLLVVQNGQAPPPADTSDINGYEFDGATQFMYVDFRDALRAALRR
jgi:3-phytase